ncbi:MAG: NUDIX domain-containing protein [Kineosporiaceae bacterium]
MPASDGDGWVHCRCGRRHWGRHGAAGLVLLRGDAAGSRVLLQHRSDQVHDGGTWALPGGARDSHEDVVTAALREAFEEVAVPAAAVTVLACMRGSDHGDWSYTYVLGRTGPTTTARPATFETAGLDWVPGAGPPPAGKRLHASLAADWPRLAQVVAALADGGPSAPA